ncbi:hypothetical protein INT43_006281 [Umbelopsis isabellina]|uniref:Uncharacterized protein n=1 Tax=Mortierella isabellina TaxID=91625 RepID=A0A8H7UIS5_MORIS|nr:hypothetical protein INT43_006281 [Umbelopsis isabellina]
MWTKGVIRKHEKIQQGRFALPSYNKHDLYELMNNDDINIEDLEKAVNINKIRVEVCWLANQEHELADYVEGIGFEWLPEETKAKHEASTYAKGLLAICELYNDECLRIIEIRKIGWQTTIYAGISALEEMHNIMKQSNKPLAMFLIGQPKQNVV